MDSRTPDQQVRAQIDAAKRYLHDSGFTELDDTVQPAVNVQKNLHTIYMRLHGEPRVLRLSYSWLEEHHPADVYHELERRTVGELLRRYPPHASILGDGTIEHPA